MQLDPNDTLTKVLHARYPKIKKSRVLLQRFM